MNPEKEILNVAEVSEWLRIPKSTMYKLCADGQIPCFKIGKHWRFRRDAVTTWFQKQSDSMPMDPHQNGSFSEYKSTDVHKAAEVNALVNLAKRELFSDLNHAFRTPLVSVIGFTEMALDKDFGKLNSEQEEHLNYALESAYQLLELINDLLDYSKTEHAG